MAENDTPPRSALPAHVPARGTVEAAIASVEVDASLKLPERESLVGVMLGEYQVTAVLGEGGMGLVYRGLQPVIGKPVAIKVLKPELAADPTIVQQLLSEARAVNAIRHPGIVDIFSFGLTPDGRQYMVMELLDGKPLDQVIAEQGRLLLHECIDVLDQLLAALAAAHGAGVIHRDLKPGNLLLTRLQDGSYRLKILDFGLAKLTAPGLSSSPQTNANLVRGTPAYMPPEQARAQPVSNRTDLYSVGVLAFELLTGQLPFNAANSMDLLMKHVSEQPPAPSSVDASIPEAVDTIVLKLMQKRPEDRYASAADVRKALARVKADLGSAGTQVRRAPQRTVAAETKEAPAVQKPTVIVERQRRPMGVLVGAGLSVLVIGGLAAFLATRAPEPAVELQPPLQPPALELVALPPAAVEPPKAVVEPPPPPEPPPAPAPVAPTESPKPPRAANVRKPPSAEAVTRKLESMKRKVAAAALAPNRQRTMASALDTLEAELKSGEATAEEVDAYLKELEKELTKGAP